MKPFNGSTSWFNAVGLLLVAYASWMTWNWFNCGKIRASSEPFDVLNIHTNGTDGVSILERKTGQPIWTQWDFNGDGTPDTISYFFQGKNIMNVHLNEGKLPRREVIFYGDDGKAKVSWGDRSGTGLFTERIFYEKGKPRLEVWYRQAWFTTEMRNNERGIIVDGRWLRLMITNGVWTPEGK